MFRTLVKEYRMEVAQGAFEQMVRELGVEMNHNVLGCRECHWEGHVAGVCTDLLLSYQRNSVGVIGGGNGGDEGGSGRF